ARGRAQSVVLQSAFQSSQHFGKPLSLSLSLPPLPSFSSPLHSLPFFSLPFSFSSSPFALSLLPLLSLLFFCLFPAPPFPRLCLSYYDSLSLSLSLSLSFTLLLFFNPLRLLHYYSPLLSSLSSRLSPLP